MSKDWRHSAACRNEDPELFFAPGVGGPALVQIAEAKAVCGRCLVSTACLEWALGSGQDYGVFGGKTEDERRTMKRRNAPPPIRTGADDPATTAQLPRETWPRPELAVEVLRLHAADLTPDQIAMRLGLNAGRLRRWIDGREIKRRPAA